MYREFQLHLVPGKYMKPTACGQRDAILNWDLELYSNLYPNKATLDEFGKSLPLSLS